ncbi:MAG: hypothetical protein H9Q65_05700 [Spiroplasma ixodetis]|nr:hypothetical protein [Spiroplasma ixodetis]
MNTSWKIPFLSLIGAEVKFNANMLKNYENDLNKLIDETVSKLKNILNKNNKQIVIIFDDLDRCTPNNQIIFLSYIKNIFLNITNIFFIVSSNNEVINQKLYTENKYELENYTDKLFNNSFDLDINFGSENLIFTENKFIKHFLKEMNITNPRLIDKIIENVEMIKSKINSYNNDFNWIKSFSKNQLEKIEFVIFYIYYLKFNKRKYYRKIIEFSNEIKIKNNYFFEIVKKFIFEKLQKNTNSLSNDDVLEWILKNSNYKTNYDIPVNFNFKNIEEPTLLNQDIGCKCFTFQFLLPFFWDLINSKNINTLFNKNINTKVFYDGIYSSMKYEVQLDWNNLELIKEQKIFLNILKINYYQRNSYLSCDCLNNEKQILTYQNIKEIIKLTIFNYSWNNNLNINNKEVKSEEIPVN